MNDTRATLFKFTVFVFCFIFRGPLYLVNARKNKKNCNKDMLIQQTII